MHELSIAQALIEQVAQVAAREKAARVLRVTVTIGSLAGVDPEALRLAYPVAAEGTVAENSELDVRWITGRVRCRACGAEDSADEPVFICAQCNSTELELLAGRELNLASVELQ